VIMLRHLIIHGDPEQDNQRLEIDYIKREIRVVNKISTVPNLGTMRFRPLYPKFKETTVAIFSFVQWKLAVNFIDNNTGSLVINMLEDDPND